MDLCMDQHMNDSRFTKRRGSKVQDIIDTLLEDTHEKCDKNNHLEGEKDPNTTLFNYIDQIDKYLEQNEEVLSENGDEKLIESSHDLIMDFNDIH